MKVVYNETDNAPVYNRYNEVIGHFVYHNGSWDFIKCEHHKERIPTPNEYQFLEREISRLNI